MGNNFWAYIERLELMTFFTGYPLIYFLVQVGGGIKYKRGSVFLRRLVILLPFAYAFSGTLFLGLILKNLYPDYSIKHINELFQNVFLTIWGLSSLLFWIPFLSKKPVFSLLHSLIFFLLLIKDMCREMFSSADSYVIRNDMKIYTVSLILNIGTLIVAAFVDFLLNKLRRRKKI